MLKACPYCGRIHDSQYDCPMKPKRWKQRKESKANSFRHTYAWKQKRDTIVKRDYQMCRICNEGSYGDFSRTRDPKEPLQVHHIEPLEECYDRRLDEENLITVCWQHHEMAEAGKIPRDYLHELADTSPRWGGDSCE